MAKFRRVNNQLQWSLSKIGAKNMEALVLNNENVETILDEMRPYLISDGGNVELVEIDGPIVKLRLQGACGSCPSSTMTLRMGIERRLRDAIPEIEEIEQVF
jgi:Fe-S cluster biogenesis protein NfuA